MNSEFDIKVMKTFSERLKAARIAAGFEEAEDFANALGVRGARYRYWERGTAKPDLTNLTRICQLLDVEPNDLLPLAIKRKKPKKGDASDGGSDPRAVA
ncbi:helix-turn-helix domain-containing protein [Hyphomicrobium sp. DMF-1]|jgi:transcriptional regulator with XRE-family HTH domain|uniref:helix-turn-helix domain-containing protein n=1 Tax=Hyphomicrobium sp. DMF-1 TaxID=3019544 RepID=UPI0022EBBFE3|nr:helix-turn-helix transcriptional regulator [Hyphomicrobium sp. DMF-1]WBT40141.1 helix-turn-helix transcriptional regulator [Hyphomicrobium sp. DMF-1]